MLLWFLLNYLFPSVSFIFLVEKGSPKNFNRRKYSKNGEGLYFFFIVCFCLLLIKLQETHDLLFDP